MRKALIAGGALALALTLGACGDDNKSGGPLGEQPGGTSEGGVFKDARGLIGAAKEGTSKAKSVKFTMDGTMGGQQMKGNGEAAFDGSASKTTMIMQLGGQQIEVRQLGNTMYMKGVPGTDPSKPWMKMQIDKIPGLSESMQRSDPSKVLDYLLEAGAEIKKTEKTEVDGQPATHYSIEVDTKKFLEKMLGQAMPDSAAGNLPAKMQVELYVNADNLPVRVDTDMGTMGKMTTKYTDWGTPVTVEEPPAGQVGEMPGGGAPSGPPSTAPSN